MKKIVADVPGGTICRHKGEWGVLGKLTLNNDSRTFDRWYGPPIGLKHHEVVDVFKPRKDVG